MRVSSGNRYASVYEFLSLCLLVFSLPIFEGPKNIASLFLLIFFLFFLVKNRLSDYIFSIYDVIVLFIFFIVVLSLVFSPFEKVNWNALVDPFRYLSIAWVVSHLRFTKKQIIIIFTLLILSTLLGSIEGVYQLKEYYGNKIYFKLDSVGHTNHSFIYLTIITLVVLSVLFISLMNQSIYLLITSLSIVALFIYLIYTGGSRASAITLFVSMFLLMGLFYNFLSKKKKILLMLCGVLPMIILVTFSQVPDNISRLIKNPDKLNLVASKRFELANTAIIILNKSPMLGVGAGGFKQINKQVVTDWSNDKNIDMKNYYFSSHAHSLYFTTLSEKGLLGILALLILLIYWGYMLYKLFPKSIAKKKDMHWLLWLASFSALLVTSINGIANTTLHHEHAILALVLFSMMLGNILSFSDDKPLG